MLCESRKKERFGSEAEWIQMKDAYRVDHTVLKRAKEDMLVMYPLPRLDGMLLRFSYCAFLIPSLEISRGRF